MKRKTYKGNIGPVLVLWKYDRRAFERKSFRPFHFDFVEHGENRMSNPSGRGIDEGIPSHRFCHPHPSIPLQKV